MALEDARADAVALARFLPDATSEHEVVGLAPLGSQRVLAQELHQLGVMDDLADAPQRSLMRRR